MAPGVVEQHHLVVVAAQPIPAQLYTAVAQVLAYVYRLKAALRGEGRMPDAQPDPYVPPELDPHHQPKAAGAAINAVDNA